MVSTLIFLISLSPDSHSLPACDPELKFSRPGMKLCLVGILCDRVAYSGIAMVHTVLNSTKMDADRNRPSDLQVVLILQDRLQKTLSRFSFSRRS
ncbi:hypothetical protein M758_12G085000 [Ceratodon purpureus]|nr:hypothetical protein M758_12G085000 [Ceratodon purpureus]